MGHLKSLEELLLLFLQQTKHSRFVSAEDLNTLRRRIAGEGLPFLVDVLPRLDKFLLARLKATEYVTSNAIVGTIETWKPRTTAELMYPAGNRVIPKQFVKVITRSYPLLGSRSKTLKPRIFSVQLRRLFPFKGASSEVELDRVRSRDLPLGFAPANGCAYPLLFRDAWAAILEKDGTAKCPTDIDVDAVMLIRQVSHLFYKLELPYTDEQISSTICAFKQAEMEVRSIDGSTFAHSGLLTRARKIVQRLLGPVDPSDIDPKHGSGSSACGVEPHKRYESFRFIPRLHAVFPYDKYFFYNNTHLSDELEKLLDAEEAEPYAKVVLVPKDSRGPRLISEEPREFMFIQQGLMKLMYGRVKRLPAIDGQIGFTDQSRNQRLACEGSRKGTFATLDLKEASDRVSWELVKYLFPPRWVDALGASRSKATMLPDGEILPLSKFAPMGSACCFPVEAICFWAIALAACGCDDAYLNRLFTNRLTKYDMQMSVFGDDIIVPTEFAQKVSSALGLVGLKVNEAKSFSTGFFRESCGGDYLYGINVTPIRCKAIPDRNDMRSVFRTVELCNNIARKYGIGRTELVLRDFLKENLGLEVPVSSRYDTVRDDYAKTSRGLYLIGRYTDVPTTYRRRWNSRLQRLEYRIPCMEARPMKVGLLGWSPLLRKACLKLDEIEADRIALPKRYRIKYRWTIL